MWRGAGKDKVVRVMSGSVGIPLGWERSVDGLTTARDRDKKLLSGLCPETVLHLPWPEEMVIFLIATAGELAPTLMPRSARGRQSASLPGLPQQAEAR